MSALRLLARAAAVLVAVCVVFLLTVGATLWLSAGPPPPLPADFAVAPPETPVSNPDLRADLLRRYALDQAVRSDSSMDAFSDLASPASLWAFGKTAVRMTRVDLPNQRRVRAAVDAAGWPTAAEIGPDGVEALFYLVIHGPLEMQREGLPSFRVAWRAGDLDGQPVAMMTDRILMYERQPQIYGTQFQMTLGSGMGLFPIRDPAGVDARRAAMGMPPLAEYLKVACDEMHVCVEPPAAS